MYLVTKKEDGLIFNIKLSDIQSEREAEIYDLHDVPIPAELASLFRVIVRARKLKFTDGHVRRLDGTPISPALLPVAGEYEDTSDVDMATLINPGYTGAACKFLHDVHFPGREYPKFPDWLDLRVYWMEKWFSLLSQPGVKKVFWAYAYKGFGAIFEAVRSLSPDVRNQISASEVFTERDKAQLGGL